MARRPAARGDAQKLLALGATPRRPGRRAGTETHRNQRAPRHIAQLGKSAAGSSGRKRRLWASHIKRRLCPFCPTSPRGPFYFVSSARLRKTCPRKGGGMRFARVRARGAFGLGLLLGKGFPLAGPTWFQRVSIFAPRSGSKLCPDWFQICFQIGPRLSPDCSQIASRLLPDSPQNPLRFPQKLPQFASGTVQNTPPFCLHLVRDFFLHARFQGARSF